MKILKISTIIIMIVMILIVFQTKIFASTTSVKNFNDLNSAVKSFLSKGEGSTKTSISESDIRSVIFPIANILTIIGVIVLVAVTIIMGMKYMFATPEQAAKLKQQLIGLVVAGVVIFGSIAIWRLVYTFLNNSGL